MKRGLLLLVVFPFSTSFSTPSISSFSVSSSAKTKKIKRRRATWNLFDGAVIEMWKRLSLTLIKQTCFLREKQDEGGDEARCFHLSKIMSLTKATVAQRGRDPSPIALSAASFPVRMKRSWTWSGAEMNRQHEKKNFSRDVLAPLTANCVWFLMPSLTILTLILFLPGTRAHISDLTEATLKLPEVFFVFCFVKLQPP